MYKISNLLFVATLGIFCSGCIKNYKATYSVCTDKLFVEVFNVNPAGVDADYLTDSLNFRLYVGKSDNEHQKYGYVCNGDSITIHKLQVGEGSSWDKIETRVLSLKKLKQEGKFE